MQKPGQCEQGSRGAAQWRHSEYVAGEWPFGGARRRKENGILASKVEPKLQLLLG
jgi:hypothetical protein